MLDMLKFYAGFEIDDFTGEPLTDAQMTELHYSKIVSLQRAAFKNFDELRTFALSNVSAVDTRETLTQHLSVLSTAKLHQIASSMDLCDKQEDVNVTNMDRGLLLDILVVRHERRLSQLEALNEMPLYPTEQTIWDESIVPEGEKYNDGCLALPKLNVQFLTMHDYLLRNLNLFRLEATYEIRKDLEDIIPRMKPYRTGVGETLFEGWSRMALVITNFAICEVGKPKIGEQRPSSVRADVSVHLNVRDHIREEWEKLRKHDIGFLVTIQAPNSDPKERSKGSFAEQFGIVAVRGCEIEGMLDENGRVIEDRPDEQPSFMDANRTYRVWMDCNQYQADVAVGEDGFDVYESFNIFMRRNPKENNFKAVLDTIRSLMNTDCVVPEWLNDVFLGFGDPNAAHYTTLDSQEASQDFNDTFLSLDHLKTCFPGYEIECAADEADMSPPFQLEFPSKKKSAYGTFMPRNVAKKKAPVAAPEPVQKKLKVFPHVPINRGPYPENQPKLNAVPFTATQVEAIRAGMQPGLNVVVGPPGTGKTDVAVQIIANLYHSNPEQRTLIVTHSNMALNQIFEKIMALDIDERHLLRLGRGEKELETDKNMSRYGRVNYILAERQKLLGEVRRLAKTLDGVDDNLAYTCETAGHFQLYHVKSRWQQFKKATAESDAAAVQAAFPFTEYFANAPQPLFKGESAEEDMKVATGCMRHIDDVFAKLKEYRAFEILHRGRDRSNYLLVHEAKIIAMTCTHAALTRYDLVNLGFKYDNVLMEESAQILEIETFIPLLLQNSQDGYNRLKRVTLIGDHHQLPPVIKNMAFKKFSNMEQSLFTRFVRLGVPTVLLDAQGRARPSLSSLYQWHYDGLGNLAHTTEGYEFTMGNPGFQYDHQVLDVGDYQGKGEVCPELHFFQNLGEAEYIAAIYMYMRLLGYPAQSVAILTTYNGQKALLRDVLSRRCEGNPLFGMPATIETVDKYQGSQNNYILLSLVRTKHVGHLRDVRRLIVALSRARLGLYVVCRLNMFKNCHELKPAFDLLLKRPTHLCLYPHERYETMERKNEDTSADAVVVKDVTQMGQHVYKFCEAYIEALNGEKELTAEAIDTAFAVPEPIPVPEPKKAAAADTPAPLEEGEMGEGGEVGQAAAAVEAVGEMATEADDTEPKEVAEVAEVAEPAKKAASPKKSPTKAKTSAKKATKKKRGRDADSPEPVEVVAVAKKAKRGKAVAEAEPDTPAEPETPVAVEPETPAEPTPMEAEAEKQDYSKSTVKQLQKLLKAKGLDTKGKKSALIERLQGAE